MKNWIAEGVARMVDGYRSRRKEARPSALDDLVPFGFAVDLGHRRTSRGRDNNGGRPVRRDAVARV